MAEKGRPRGFDRDVALRRAMKTFWAKTYEGTSMTDLTTSMKIASPSLYAAFGNKEALFGEALELYANNYGREIWDGLEHGPTVREAITQFLTATAEAYCVPGNPPGCMIVLGAQHGWDADSAVHRNLCSRRQKNLKRLQMRFQRAVDTGELAPDFDVFGAAVFYLTVQTGMSVLARDGGGRKALEAVAHAGIQAWRGLSKTTAPG